MGRGGEGGLEFLAIHVVVICVGLNWAMTVVGEHVHIYTIPDEGHVFIYPNVDGGKGNVTTTTFYCHDKRKGSVCNKEAPVVKVGKKKRRKKDKKKKNKTCRQPAYSLQNNTLPKQAQ